MRKAKEKLGLSKAGAQRRSLHKGYLNLVLHAHLPYIRHPEHDYFLEENWLYEAVTECYIPLLNVFHRLLNDRVKFRLTLSLSPTLVEMFNDELLQQRCLRYMHRLIELSEKEILRTRGDLSFESIARMYHERFRKTRYLYEDIYKKDLTSAFRSVAETGSIEIITSAATHGYLPTLGIHPQAVRAQILVGAENHKRNFSASPRGMWLPECGYFPGLDSILKEAGIRFFFLEAHGVLNAQPMPKYGTFMPVLCDSGIAAFGRDIESSRQVWSSIEGYPGDFNYRDFYRDIGFDLPIDYIKPYIQPDGTRIFTGIKYFQVTGRTQDKTPYIRAKALKKADEHAENFIMNRKNIIRFLTNTLCFDPLITAPYDAELFGHWWFEGPEWLESLLRKISAGKDNVLETITPSEYLCCNKKNLQRVKPAMSSWGEKGFNEVWLNSANSWVYRHLHRAVERMIELANAFPYANGLLSRALNQAAREVLLSQHSDWLFIIKTGAAGEYASKRIHEHLENFDLLYRAIQAGEIREDMIADLEGKDRIFKWVDYRVYSDNVNSFSNG